MSFDAVCPMLIMQLTLILIVSLGCQSTLGVELINRLERVLINIFGWMVTITSIVGLLVCIVSCVYNRFGAFRNRSRLLVHIFDPNLLQLDEDTYDPLLSDYGAEFPKLVIANTRDGRNEFGHAPKGMVRNLRFAIFCA